VAFSSKIGLMHTMCFQLWLHLEPHYGSRELKVSFPGPLARLKGGSLLPMGQEGNNIGSLCMERNKIVPAVNFAKICSSAVVFDSLRFFLLAIAFSTTTIRYRLKLILPSFVCLMQFVDCLLDRSVLKRFEVLVEFRLCATQLIRHSELVRNFDFVLDTVSLYLLHFAQYA